MSTPRSTRTPKDERVLRRLRRVLKIAQGHRQRSEDLLSLDDDPRTEPLEAEIVRIGAPEPGELKTVQTPPNIPTEPAFDRAAQINTQHARNTLLARAQRMLAAVEENTIEAQDFVALAKTVREMSWDLDVSTYRAKLEDKEIRDEEETEILEQLVRWYPLRRIVEPSEVASAVAFLASDAASAISGAVLPVDCGLSAGNIVMSRELTLEEF